MSQTYTLMFMIINNNIYIICVSLKSKFYVQNSIILRENHENKTIDH